jgi:rieske iron-sulfur protein
LQYGWPFFRAGTVVPTGRQPNAGYNTVRDNADRLAIAHPPNPIETVATRARVMAAEPAGTDRCSASGEYAEPTAGRRRLLQASAAAALGLLPTAAHAQSDDPKRMMRPQAGDLLVRYAGEQQETVIAAEDIKPGDAPLIAWAIDPATKQPRDGSRLNQILLLRLDPSTLETATQTHAADGIVAYSAICTHAQCTVTGWIQDRQMLHCPCHQSEYDPRSNGKVTAGPAPRPLAALPLKISDGKLEVAGGFIGKVGMTQPIM